MPTNTVDRCVCHCVMFKDMLPIIHSLQQSGIVDEQRILNELRNTTKCTTGCAMCEPYIRQTIRTGQVRFAPLSTEPAPSTTIRYKAPQSEQSVSTQITPAPPDRSDRSTNH